MSRVTFQNSLLLKLGGAMALITLLSLLSMTLSGVVAETAQGSGEAINLAGSLRMQSYRMASLALSAQQHDNGDARRQLRTALRYFESTLNHPAIRAMTPEQPNSDLFAEMQRITTHWRLIRPRFERFLMAPGHNVPFSQTDFADIDSFVDEINNMVKHLEQATEGKILLLRMLLGSGLAVTLLVTALSLYLARTDFVLPLRDLLAFAHRVGRGELEARTEHTGEDELGKLGQAFNLMAEELNRLYQDLESRVAAKTAELTRSNQSLELLYHSIARLQGAAAGKVAYTAMLKDIEDVLGVGHGIICLGIQGGSHGEVVASTMRPGDANPCDRADCNWCHVTTDPRVSIMNGGRQLLTLPLSDAERQYGVLIVDVHEGGHPEAWQVQLLEALSRHIGVAIGAEQRIEQKRRVALLEERAVIARELHDSLAQSLAYMRIQVSRLQHSLKDPDQRAEADLVLAELRDGMSGAYRQLRELLTTFRLKMDGQDLASALRQTVDEFAERGQLAIDLFIDLNGCPLSPNEEIHILHVVREALSNVLNHAHASHVRVALVSLPDGRAEVCIADDGIGIVKAADMHHYGTTIMEERARTLAGEIRFESPPKGGACVTLTFRPASRRSVAQTPRNLLA